ncbi:hypothetical protein [Streptomyces sp. NPDC007905]|uniref:hypothetical protein n=1 Tax=Streptomyces sp. NPDC007905 TaxID=3364788 RepID=UPI0036E4FFA3
MRWWAGGWVAAVVVVLLAGCGAPAGGGSGASAGPSESRGAGPSESPGGSAGPSESRSERPSPSTRAPSSPSVSASASAEKCAARQAEVTVSPGGPVRQRVCVRPGTVVTLVLRPRVDDKRWTGVRSSAPALVLPSGWRVAADGTAHATLRCAGTRGGAVEITAAARAPDVAGAARTAFTLDVDVVPYAREG